MSSTEDAYLAGLIDGEGCITIAKRKETSLGPVFQLRVAITLRESWLLEEIKARFGGSLSIQKSKHTQRADCWNLSLWGNGASDLIEAVYPYLKLKKRQAYLGVFFQKRRNGKRTGLEVVTETEQATLMQGFNKRGVNR